MAIDEKFLDKAGLIYYDTKVKARDAQKSELPTKLTDLNNDGNFVQDAAYKHTDNNYTDAEKTKLAGIDTGADVNVIEAITVNGAAAQISNKTVNVTVPTKLGDLANDGNFVQDANYVHTDNNYTVADKSKLAGIEASADVNIIESVKVNGVALDVTEKAVNVTVPTKLTDLNNDGNFVQDTTYKHTDNNYTNAEKTKLAGIDESADVNLIESVKVNGAPLEIDSGKAVNITVPTDNASLANGAGYQTATDVNNLINAKGYQTASQVNSIVNTAVANAAHLKRAIVDVLPESGEENTIYLVPSASSKNGNVKDEYMWINSAWEKIGSSEVDLTGYLKESDLTVITTAEIDAMFA